MTRYMNPAVRIISLLAGALTGGVLTLVLALNRVARPWAWGLMAGAVAALLVCICMVLLVRREVAKVMEAQSRVPGQVLCYLYAGVRSGDINRHGYIFLTEQSVFIYLWEKKPYLETELHRADFMVRYSEAYPFCTLLDFKGEDENIALIGNAIPQLIGGMRDNGYEIAQLSSGDLPGTK